ncbi:hypothetical protein CDAR_531611 [Caerostris darwini]|uniref:Uncharacterized protein n=1 Tax=Caerostris darwini TaxID=1538125 RepID=A0AAV4QWB0_9ARAC|nr:hypothetical protein CDAR_531611 [Caerostris darwini]
MSTSDSSSSEGEVGRNAEKFPTQQLLTCASQLEQIFNWFKVEDNARGTEKGTLAPEIQKRDTQPPPKPKVKVTGIPKKIPTSRPVVLMYGKSEILEDSAKLKNLLERNSKCPGKHFYKTCKQDSASCRNCLETNSKLSTVFDGKHCAVDKDCTVYQKDQLMALQSTQYGP